MIKKFFSRALLSVVMDKSARQKLDAMQDPDGTSAAPLPAKSAKEKKSKPRPPRPPDDDMLDGLPESLIQHAVDEARREARVPPPTSGRAGPGGQVSAERQKLLDEAMAVHRKQSKLLDDLPEEQRERLTVMAMTAFGDAHTKRKKKKS